MHIPSRRLACAASLVCATLVLLHLRPTVAHAQLDATVAPSITYRITVPEPQHHWMQVEVTFDQVPVGALELRMSRTSPGRYSVHDFAKNVYDVHVTGEHNEELQVTRPDPSGWLVPTHAPHVTVRYKVFGDRTDGTYLGIDTTHAHINMPAALMWARGLDARPLRLTLEPPAHTDWTVATQWYPTADPYSFTAPNLAYAMDSPAELGPVSVRTFTQGGQTFRFAAHHLGTDQELSSLVADVEQIVDAERAIFRETPRYEPGSYTFIADYLPWANGDGMEHRNSTVVTSSGSIASQRSGLLDTVAHEYFHNWNVERIRPQSLEPFDLDRANMSGELWLAEGFTQYYGPLAQARAGVAPLSQTTTAMQALLRAVLVAPGRHVRSVVAMSQMAPFIDGGRPIDRTNWSNTVTSYYPFGGAIALGLDLTLRQRSHGTVTLDDFMRAMWREHGAPPSPRPGYVAHPYTLVDVEQRLAEVSGDAHFAQEFFSRFVYGQEAIDYAPLLEQAGFLLRPRAQELAWWGDVTFDSRGGWRLQSAPSSDSPLYAAGLDVDDVIVRVDGAAVTSAPDVAVLLGRHTPGDRLRLDITGRGGVARVTTVTLSTSPDIELVPMESAGRPLTPAQRAFRLAWLGRSGD